MPDYLPTREAELLPYSQNYSATLTASPATYGVLPADATALSSLVTGFANAYTEASDPNTRTKPKIVAKDLAKAQLIASLRSLSQRIQNNPAVSAEKKSELGLPIWDREPSTVPAPSTRPVISLVAAAGNLQLLRVVDETTPTSKAKPEGVAGVEIYAWIGETPPAELSQWQSKGLFTRSSFEISYTSEDAAKQATLMARWYNAKGEYGPVSEPITALVAGSPAA
jgi:hypothetical protein